MGRNGTFTIYTHINPLTGKAYIGQTHLHPYLRWNAGQSYPEKSFKDLYKDLKEIGWSNFKHIVLEDNILTFEKADELEKYYINKYSNEKGVYNIHGGGSLGGKGYKVNKKIPIYQIDNNLNIVAEFASIYDATSKMLYDLEDAGKDISNYLNISGAASFIKMCVKGKIVEAFGYHWCRKSDYKQDWKPEAYKKHTKVVRINPNNFLDVKLYSSIIDAAYANNTTKDAICSCIKRGTITGANYYWVYPENYNQNWKPKQKKTILGKIICVETQAVYKNLKEARYLTGMWLTSTDIKLGKPVSRYYPYHFVYIKDKENQEKLKDFIGVQPLGKKRIRCIETGQEFESPKHVAAFLNVSVVNVYKILLNKIRKYKHKYKFNFEYIYDFDMWYKMLSHKKEREVEIPIVDLSTVKEEIVLRNRKMAYKKPIVCLETGVQYESAAEASRQTGVKNINMCLLGYRKICGGLTWKYAEDKK